MRSTLLTALCLAMVGLTSGCFETTQVITMNPDGSGKVEFVNLLSAPPTQDANAPKPDMAMAARQAMQQMLTHAKGVDAWGELKCAVSDDGRSRISGVAYFSDFAKFRMGALNGEEMLWAKNDKGSMTLNLDAKKNDEKGMPATLSDAEIKDRIKGLRAEYQNGKGIRDAVMASMKMDLTFVLPGTVQEEGCFTKTDKGMQILITGPKILAAMDKIMADDALLAKSIRSGVNPVKDSLGGEKFGEAVLGKKGQPKVVVGGELKSLFDFKTEVEKAKAIEPGLFKKLGVDPSGKAITREATSRVSRTASQPASAASQK